MKVIIGLGNPGPEYDNSLHNVGYWVVDQIYSAVFNSVDNWQFKKSLQSELVNVQLEEQEVLLVKPQTYMNTSGRAVRNVLRRYPKLSLTDLLIVHDDLSFRLGSCKFSRAKGANGHNGVQSIIDTLGDRGFWRLRIGVDSPRAQRYDDKAAFVLSQFSQAEGEQLDGMFTQHLLQETRRWVAGKIR